MSRHSGSTRPSKPCSVCGRTIAWRKKWERDWASVRYCSKACRSRGISDTDRALEAAILEQLGARKHGATMCPSEAARAVGDVDWRSLMEPARMAARRLMESGQLVITQQGHPVEPSTAKGPIRLRLA
ncbi:MAG: DUF2256 and DUF3253 domain-containing protein [Planctomycetota bacterium]